MKRPVAYFAGTGRGIPATVMTNHDFAALGIETNDEWIVERTGIQRAPHRQSKARPPARWPRPRRARRWNAPACTAGELDIIVLSTASTDRLLPSTAVDLQAELGAIARRGIRHRRRVLGIHLRVDRRRRLIATGIAETVLVVGVEKLSSIVDWTDRSTCVLFGDGAGAAVLKRSLASTASEGNSRDVHAERRHARRLALSPRRRSDAFRSPSTVLTDRSHFIKMDGREVFKHAVRSMAEAADARARRGEADRRRTST